MRMVTKSGSRILEEVGLVSEICRPYAPLDRLLCRGRKTKEGFLIFKEDELGIGTEGGGEAHLVHISVFLLIFISFLQTRRYAHLIANVVCQFSCEVANLELTAHRFLIILEKYKLWILLSIPHGSFEASRIASQAMVRRGQCVANINYSALSILLLGACSTLGVGVANVQ